LRRGEEGEERQKQRREEEEGEAKVKREGAESVKKTVRWKTPKKKNAKKKNYEIEAEKWEEMKREGKVDDCRLWIPLEVKKERTLVLYNTGTMKSFTEEAFV